MPTYYAPGKRYKPGSGKRNETFVVRGSIDGVQREYTTTAYNKKGRGGAEEQWAEFERGIWAERDQPVTPETATFADAVALYRKDRDISRNEGRYIKILETYFADTALHDIDLAMLHAAAYELYPGSLPQTKNRQVLRPAGAVLHNAQKKHKLCDWIVIETLREDDPQRPIAYPEDIDPLIAAARAAKDKELAALLTTFQFQGWRVTETIGIRRERIDWGKKRLLRWVAKSQKWRWAGVANEVLTVWRRLKQNEDGRLFSFKDRHEVYARIDALGLPHFRPHMARRGFASALKDAGVDPADIAQAGQWQDIKSVMAYVADDPERGRRTIARIGGRIRGKRKLSRKNSA